MANPQIGTVSQLVNGTITLIMPVKVNFWYMQNQSTQPLKVTFKQGSAFGPWTSIVLAAAAAAGAPGGYLDSVAFPYFDDMTLSSADLTAPFGSGAGVRVPTNNYSYPGNQGGISGTP